VSRAREIATTLREWIAAGRFLLGEPQLPVPTVPWTGSVPEPVA